MGLAIGEWLRFDISLQEIRLVLKLDHVAIVVRDLEKALRLYKDGLGLVLEHTEELAERGVRVAFLRTGETRVELIEPVREDSEVSAFLEKRGEGLHHIAFRVCELNNVIRRSLEAGAKPIEQTSGHGALGHKVAFLHPKSTFGVLIELVEGQDA